MGRRDVKARLPFAWCFRLHRRMLWGKGGAACGLGWHGCLLTFAGGWMLEENP